MRQPKGIERLTMALAGTIGAAGVGLAAAATHVGGTLLGPASAMCLAHAPAMFALVAARPLNRTAGVAALMMAAGAALFSGDLVARQFHGAGVFPMAAPTGGLTMIAAWLLAAVGALLPARPSQ